MKQYETIIIGAGISGLSCAHELNKNHKKFKIISEDIGGRIIESKHGNIGYGAYYIMDIYNKTKEYVELKEKIKLSETKFHKCCVSYSIFNKRLFSQFPQMMKLIYLLFKFKNHYKSFKKRCIKLSQKEAFNLDPYLLKLYNTNAEKFVKEQKIEDIVLDYIAPGIRGTTFTSIDKINAFTFLHFSLPFIVPLYKFIFLKDKLLNEFKKDIIKDSVLKIKKQKQGYSIVTKTKTYFAKNVVVATSPSVSQKLLNIKKIKGPAKAHMFHLIGQIKNNWDDSKENFFSDKNRMLVIAHQFDNDYLFYSKGKHPDFKKYFYKYKIIKHKFWNPAFNIIGSELWDCEQDKGLYLIGDHNVCGLEDAFITGVYAANQIVENPKK